jgi:hypothetical protein
VAKEAGVPVIDLWSLFQQTQNWQQAYLSDGLHLTPRGNRVVFEELVNVLNCRPYLTADELPMDFPPFSEIDWKNPPSIFQAKECNTAHVLVLIFLVFLMILSSLYVLLGLLCVTSGSLISKLKVLRFPFTCSLRVCMMTLTVVSFWQGSMSLGGDTD